MMNELVDIFQNDIFKLDMRPRIDYSDEKKSLPYLHDYNLKSLLNSQRVAIAFISTIICILAIVANGFSLFYNFRRNIRPIFRTCLISLSCSDIIVVSFIYIAYMSQMIEEYTALWSLGDILCSLIPFASTAAILVNSLTLVGIALDRYWAVVKVINGIWNPSAVLCTAWAVFVWGLAAGIASPLITSFYIIEFFIIETDPSNHSIEIDVKLAAICVGDKEITKYYYTVVFHLIFAPLIVMFVWLNSVIAKEIWNKRRPIDARPFDSNSDDTSISKRTTDSTIMSAYMNGKFNHEPKDKVLPIAEQHSQVSTITTSTSTPSGSTNWLTKPATTNNFCYRARKLKTCREIRQMRMFKAVLALMIVFIVCRMPTWIYLLVKMYSVANTNIMWMLHFSLGLLSLSNCVINPFIYTFLIETIQYSCRFIQCVKRVFCCFKYKSTNDGY